MQQSARSTIPPVKKRIKEIIVNSVVMDKATLTTEGTQVHSR
jgi:hypothetical protein